MILLKELGIPFENPMGSPLSNIRRLRMVVAAAGVQVKGKGLKDKGGKEGGRAPAGKIASPPPALSACGCCVVELRIVS
jgi:hypothetical protein